MNIDFVKQAAETLKQTVITMGASYVVANATLLKIRAMTNDSKIIKLIQEYEQELEDLGQALDSNEH